MSTRRIEFEFSDLPGVAGGRLIGVPRHSVNGIVEGLLWNRLVWATGDSGANIIVYRDDAIRFRCFFHQRLFLKESQVFTTKTQVRDWLSEWFPRLSTATPLKVAAE